MKKQMIQRAGFMLSLFSIIILMACNSEQTSNSDTDSTAMSEKSSMKSVQADIAGVFPDTAVSGTAAFTEKEGGKVSLDLQLNIPSKANSTVAVHIHENGGCGDMGKAAGGHWNPTNEDHGKWGGEHFHSGDIGNVTLDGEGKGSMTMETDRWSIGGAETTDIMNKSIIVHGGTDDFTSQPAGNAGTRIGCGVIKGKENNM